MKTNVIVFPLARSKERAPQRRIIQLRDGKFVLEAREHIQERASNVNRKLIKLEGLTGKKLPAAERA